MASLPQKIVNHLARKLWRDRAGYGRPITAEALDQEYRSGNWDHFFSSEELPRNLVVAGLIHAAFPQPSILDVGCGSGRLATVFQAYPYEHYCAVDVSVEGLARARALQLPRVEWIEGNYETWRPDRLYDAIVFNECIGYATDPAATLATFANYLSSGGAFFLSHFRFGNYAAQWRRMASVCETQFATAVMSSQEQIWDIRVLRPKSARGTFGLAR